MDAQKCAQGGRQEGLLKGCDLEQNFGLCRWETSEFLLKTTGRGQGGLTDHTLLCCPGLGPGSAYLQ